MVANSAGLARSRDKVCFELSNQYSPTQCKPCGERSHLLHASCTREADPPTCPQLLYHWRKEGTTRDMMTSCCLYSFASLHLHPGEQITVDPTEWEYKFPQDVATTDSRPEMVIWKEDSIVLVELTIPFEEDMEASTERKRSKYAGLLARYSSTRHAAHLTTIEVGSRGFINALALVISTAT